MLLVYRLLSKQAMTRLAERSEEVLIGKVIDDPGK